MYNNNNQFKYPIHSVENAFSLLEVLAGSGLELGIAEFCKKLGLPKGTVHRLLGTLKNLGYIKQNPLNRKYWFTAKILKLGSPVTDNIGLFQIIPYMQKLSQKFNETANLAILDGDEILYIYNIEGNNTLKLDLRIGSHQPAYCAALGRVLLAYLKEEEINDYLERVELKSYTPNTITSKGKLKKELELVKRKGYCFIKEEYMLGVFCVAVPLRDNQGKVCTGLSFTIPTARFNEEKVSLIVDSLISTAKQITIPGFFSI